MALAQHLEELLAQMKVSGADEKEIETLRKSLETHQVLRDGYLRQNDYDKKMNEAKTERAKEQDALKNARERAERLQKWADENVPKHNELLGEYKKLEAKNKELEDLAAKAAARVSGGDGGGGGEVDETKLKAAIMEEVNKRGYVSPAEVSKIAMEQAQKIITDTLDKERKEFFEKTVPNVMEWNAKMNDFAYEHREEFGEKFDRKGFAKFVTEKKIEDLDEGYKMYVSEKRMDKRIKEETDKRVKDELAKRNIPGSGASPAPTELGPLQARRSGTEPDGLPADATISAAAMAAAAELRKEGRV